MVCVEGGGDVFRNLVLTLSKCCLSSSSISSSRCMPPPLGSSIQSLDRKRPPLHKKKCHETDLEMSPGPLGTTIFEKTYIRIMGNPGLRLEIGFKTGL